jgi:shikimate dehydrogenase
LPASALTERLLVFDTLYGPGAASFRAETESVGARWTDGLGMLLHQGAAAFTLWTDRAAPLEVMRDALQRAFSASRR